jgi:hypothetical protein
MPSFEMIRAASPSIRYRIANLASQVRVALANMAWNTGSNSPGELEMTRNTSEVALCCSSASASLFSRCARGSRSATPLLAFVPAERRPRTPVRALLDNAHLVGTVSGRVPSRTQPRIALPILTEPNHQLACRVASFDHLVDAGRSDDDPNGRRGTNRRVSVACRGIPDPSLGESSTQLKGLGFVVRARG